MKIVRASRTFFSRFSGRASVFQNPPPPPKDFAHIIHPWLILRIFAYLAGFWWFVPGLIIVYRSWQVIESFVQSIPVPLQPMPSYILANLICKHNCESWQKYFFLLKIFHLHFFTCSSH